MDSDGKTSSNENGYLANNTVFERSFRRDMDFENQLRGVKNQPGEITRDLLTEDEIAKHYYSLRFRQIKYGTFQGRPAGLLVIDGQFDPPPPSHRHRFKWATIELDFGRAQNPHDRVEILKAAPEVLHGKITTRGSTWQWSIGFGPSATIGPVNLKIFDFSINEEITYSTERMAKIRGILKGGPPSRVVFSLEEGQQDGLPPHIPSLVLLVGYPQGKRFKATVAVQANIGFSLSPSWLRVRDDPDDELWFDDKVEKGPDIDRNFDNLDLESLYAPKLYSFSRPSS